MTITITTHKQYECCGSKFYALGKEILVVADYWADADREASKKPLSGFGSNTIGKYCNLAKKEIFEKITAEYGKEAASTGVTLLGIPKLVMRFKIR